MKKLILILAVVVSGFQGVTVYGQNTKAKTEQKQTVQKTDKVYGNCGCVTSKLKALWRMWKALNLHHGMWVPKC